MTNYTSHQTAQSACEEKKKKPRKHLNSISFQLETVQVPATLLSPSPNKGSHLH